MLDKLYGNMDVLTAAVDGNSARYQSVSNNIANVNTPGYKKTTVNFEDELQNIISNSNTKVDLKKTNKNHIGKDRQSLEEFEPTLKEHKETSTRRDGNNVNPDIEMINLAKTSITYNALIEQINRRFNKLQSVITEGGK